MQSPAEAEERGWQGEGADHMDVSLLVQDHDPSNPRSQDYGDDENDGEDDGSLGESPHSPPILSLPPSLSPSWIHPSPFLTAQAPIKWVLACPLIGCC